MSPSKRPQTPIRLEDEIRTRLDLFLSQNRRKWKSINGVVNEALDQFLPSLAELMRDAPQTPPAPVEPKSSDTLDFE